MYPLGKWGSAPSDSDSGCESDAPCFLYTSVNELWMLDSGASDHFTPFGSDFERGTYVSFQDSTQSVTLGDSATQLRVIGKGTVKRWVETSPNRSRNLVLENVLHVDGIKKTLGARGPGNR